MDNLFEAINQGRLDLVKTFLTDDPNLINKVASVDEKEFTPIELALSRGFKDIVREIIKFPDFDINKQGHNPLLLAISVNFQRFPTLDAKKLVNAPKMSAHHRGICHF